MSNRRPSKEQVFMNVAKAWAERSTCSSRIAVGAVLVNQHNQVIASGYNGSASGQPHCDECGCDFDESGHCQRSIHAEENAILQCAANGASSRGCVMYVTHSPCPRCAQRMIQAGVRAVIFEIEYRDLQATELILQTSDIGIAQLTSDQEWLDD